MGLEGQRPIRGSRPLASEASELTKYVDIEMGEEKQFFKRFFSFFLFLPETRRKEIERKERRAIIYTFFFLPFRFFSLLGLKKKEN